MAGTTSRQQSLGVESRVPVIPLTRDSSLSSVLGSSRTPHRTPPITARTTLRCRQNSAVPEGPTCKPGSPSPRRPSSPCNIHCSTTSLALAAEATHRAAINNSAKQMLASIDDHITNVERDSGTLHGHYLSILSCTQELDKQLVESGTAAGISPSNTPQETSKSSTSTAVPPSPVPGYTSLDLSRIARAPESSPQVHYESVDLNLAVKVPESSPQEFHFQHGVDKLENAVTMLRTATDRRKNTEAKSPSPRKSPCPYACTPRQVARQVSVGACNSVSEALVKTTTDSKCLANWNGGAVRATLPSMTNLANRSNTSKAVRRTTSPAFEQRNQVQRSVSYNPRVIPTSP